MTDIKKKKDFYTSDLLCMERNNCQPNERSGQHLLSTITLRHAIHSIRSFQEASQYWATLNVIHILSVAMLLENLPVFGCPICNPLSHPCQVTHGERFSKMKVLNLVKVAMLFLLSPPYTCRLGQAERACVFNGCGKTAGTLLIKT